MTPSLLSFLLLGALTFVSGAVGAGLTRRLKFLNLLERAVFAVPVGMGVWSLLVLFGGLMGIFPFLLWKILLAIGMPLAVLGAYFALQYALTARTAKPPPFVITAWIALGIVGVCTAISALAPPAGLEWDSLSYHLANQKVWLQRGRIEYLPWDHHSNFPFLVQMLYLVMLAIGGTGLEQSGIGAAKLIHWLCGALLVLSVYTFCRRHIAPADDGSPSPQGTSAGLVAALLVATTPLVLWESTTAYVDLATALFTWLSLYALVNAAQAASEALTPPAPLSHCVGEGGVDAAEVEPSTESDTSLTPPSPTQWERGAGGVRASDAASVPWLVTSAVLMGFALGTKYTVLGFWGLCLVALLGWNLVLTRRFDRVTIPHTALWGGISLAIGLPWYVKNWIVTGNPVYPFAYGIFGGRYWSAENAAQYAAEQANFGLGKSPLNLLLSPWDVTMEAALLPAHFEATRRQSIYTEYVLYGLALSPVWVGLVVALPLLLGRKRLSRPSIYCLLFAVGVGAFWFFVMQQTRYLLPALAPLAVVLAEVVTGLWEEKGRWLRYPVAAFTGASVCWGVYLAVGLAFLGVPLVYGAGTSQPAWPVVSGQVSRESYVTRTVGGVASASLWINRNSAPTETVVLFDEVRGFYLDRPYLWGQPDHASGLIPWESYNNADDWLQDFKRRGYTLLLLGARRLDAPDDGKRWRQLLNEAIMDDKVTPVFEAPAAPETRGVRVFRIP